MRTILFMFMLFWAQVTYAQNFYYPKLPVQVNKIENLVIPNWKIIDTAYGDLNNDQLEDLALVLEYNTPITEKRAYGDDELELIKEFQKPRILAVYFKQAKSKKYIAALQNNSFILRSEEGGTLGDPFRDLTINNQQLALAFEGGANWRWKLNYKFEFAQNEWKLANANNVYYNINSGEMTERNYNFMDRKVTVTTGNLFNRGVANKIDEGILLFSQPRTFSNFKKPWTWEITKDNFL